jgi:signal transduction histidine kinase
MDIKQADTTINYKKIFDASPSLFLLLRPDKDFTIIDASDSYLEATLTVKYEIKGKPLFTVFPDNPDEPGANGTSNLRNSLLRVINNKKADTMPIQKYDIPIPKEKGGGYEERYWNPMNTPVFDENKEVEYIIHQVEDVTATVYLKKELESKLVYIKENEDRVNSILSALLKFTTMDFSERLVLSDKGDELDAIASGLNSLIEELENQINLLTSANKNLEYANMELDSFSYSVSHDLRAPLRAINGYSQVLLEDYGDQLNDEGKRNLDIIIKNAKKMGALIDDLLTFSRVGKQNLTKVFLNMNALLESVVNDFMNQPQKNEVEFRINPLQIAEGDNSMVKLVMTNLISNAIKYSGKKERSVVEIGSYKENENLVYYVKDNGAGFDMKYYDKLFGVFQRLHSSTEFEGTGVGLALVHRIIKKHQGNVWAKAKPDEGATFYFSLPINLNP